MSTLSSTERRIETLLTLSCRCEEEFSQITVRAQRFLTFYASAWMMERIFDNCGAQNGYGLNPRCVESEYNLKLAIFTQLACMSLQTLALTTKCVSAAWLRRDIS
ncbi:MAG: hypothetical protein JSS10_06775 [Verrucomicrobia bacterium]|nr:hypothetical protein [Verrucomicrobiota bacterium]